MNHEERAKVIKRIFYLVLAIAIVTGVYFYPKPRVEKPTVEVPNDSLIIEHYHLPADAASEQIADAFNAIQKKYGRLVEVRRIDTQKHPEMAKAQGVTHLLVSNNLASKLDGVDVVHINSEFKDRVSDHDPVLARFNLPVPGTTSKTRNDFNVDSKSDILWRNDNGSVAIWQMNGTNVLSSGLTSIPTTANSWKIAGTGDFNGDAKSDILWRNDNGSVAIWQMDGNNVVSSGLTSISFAETSWKIAGTGDFNNDQKSDILWRNDDGSVAIWQMNGINVLSADLTSVPDRDNSWKIAQTDDFNGDAKSDILWRNDIGSVEIWQMNGNNVLASSGATSIPLADTSWKVAAPIL